LSSVSTSRELLPVCPLVKQHTGCKGAMPEVTLPGRIEGEIAFTEKWAKKAGCSLLLAGGVQSCCGRLNPSHSFDADTWSEDMVRHFGRTCSNSRDIHDLHLIEAAVYSEALGV